MAEKKIEVSLDQQQDYRFNVNFGGDVARPDR